MILIGRQNLLTTKDVVVSLVLVVCAKLVLCTSLSNVSGNCGIIVWFFL